MTDAGQAGRAITARLSTDPSLDGIGYRHEQTVGQAVAQRADTRNRCIAGLRCSAGSGGSPDSRSA